MTTRATAAKHDGMNSVVTYKWLLSILGPVALALATGILWAVSAMLAPVEQKAESNADRLDRQDHRVEKQLDRIEEKVDRIGEHVLKRPR